MCSGRPHAFLVLAVLLGSVAGGSCARVANRGEGRSFTVPDFSGVNQDGRRVTNTVLVGKPWILDFIFTRCTGACPVLSARMTSLQRQLSRRDLRFISVSVDPEYDTPQVLKRYADRWGGDQERWWLLRIDQQSLRELAGGVKAVVERTNDPVDPIIHSNRFVLVDAQGTVRGSYDTGDADQLKRLVRDAEELSTPTLSSSSADAALAIEQPANGEALLVGLGCNGCHARAEVAQPLGGLFGRAVRLRDGRTVVADEAYLRESILDPSSKVVEGYGDTMPSYKDLVTEGQLDVLITYIESMKGPPSDDPSGYLATDPVCGMKVRAPTGVPSVKYDGVTYAFCSERCREVFVSGHLRDGAPR